MSAPCGIPGAEGLKRNLLNALPTTEGESNHVGALVAQGDNAPIGKIALESVLQIAEKHAPGTIAEFLSSLRTYRAFSRLHSFQAHVTERVGISFTTNIDVAIESAATDRACLSSYTGDRNSSFSMPLGAPPTLIKLHGCSSAPQSVAMTLNTIGQGLANNRYDRLFRELPEDGLLLFIGYRGIDRDIMPAIHHFRGEILWLQYAPRVSGWNPGHIEEESRPLNALVAKHPRCTTIVGDPTSFLSDVAATLRIDLHESRAGEAPGSLGAFADMVKRAPPYRRTCALAEVMLWLGHWRPARDILTSIPTLAEMDTLDRLETRALIGDSLSRQHDDSSISQLESLASESLAELEAATSGAFHLKCRFSSLRCYAMEYSAQVEAAIGERRQMLRQVEIQVAPDEKSAFALDQERCSIMMNIANGHYWLAMKPGNIFDIPELRASVRQSERALEIANRRGLYVEIAKLRENVCHTKIKLLFAEQGISLDSRQHAREIQDQHRQPALDYWSFIGDLQGEYHSVNNALYEEASFFYEAPDVVQRCSVLALRLIELIEATRKGDAWAYFLESLAILESGARPPKVIAQVLLRMAEVRHEKLSMGTIYQENVRELRRGMNSSRCG